MLPLGTILTVPKCTKLSGWEDVNSSNSDIEPVYVGTVKFSLGMDESDIWKDWNKIEHLDYYPELKKAIHFFIESIPFDENRKIWEENYKLGRLPSTQFLFPRIDSVGRFSLGSNSSNYFMPFIEHTENQLRPIGRSTEELPKKLYSPVLGNDIDKTNIPTNFVLLAQRASNHTLEEEPYFLGSENVGNIPAHLGMKLLVCTITHYPNVPLSHKLIIKVK